MLLSEDEVKIKSQLWFAENADFLKELEGNNKDMSFIYFERYQQLYFVNNNLKIYLFYFLAKKEKLAALEAEKANKTKKVFHY